MNNSIMVGGGKMTRERWVAKARATLRLLESKLEEVKEMDPANRELIHYLEKNIVKVKEFLRSLGEDV